MPVWICINSKIQTFNSSIDNCLEKQIYQRNDEHNSMKINEENSIDTYFCELCALLMFVIASFKVYCIIDSSLFHN